MEKRSEYPPDELVRLRKIPSSFPFIVGLDEHVSDRLIGLTLENMILILVPTDTFA